MFRRKSPSEYWDALPVRLGWSMLDMTLVELRGSRKSKKLQLRRTDDGSFPIPDGLTLNLGDQLIDAGRWNMAWEVVDVAASGTRIATGVNVGHGYTLNLDHADVILYRIAHGMLVPDDVLVETLSRDIFLNKELDRIDLERLRNEIPAHRIPTAEEFDSTFNLAKEYDVRASEILEVFDLEEASDETLDAAFDLLDRHHDDSPFQLEGAPYLRV